MDESKLSAISQLLLRCSPSDVVDLPFGDIIERLELGLDKDFLPVLKGKSTSIVNVSKRLRSLRSLYKIRRMSDRRSSSTSKRFPETLGLIELS